MEIDDDENDDPLPSPPRPPSSLWNWSLDGEDGESEEVSLWYKSTGVGGVGSLEHCDRCDLE